MCYNSTISFSFFGVGMLVTLYIYLFSPAVRNTGIYLLLLFYSLMELLQGVQYFYVNQCNNKINRWLTECAYTLVILQPFLWNLYFYANSNKYDKNIFITAIWLCVCWMIVNIFGRVMYKKTASVQTQNNSIYAANKVCTKKNLSHLYWEWTSANFGDLNANFLTYLMLWFIPALVSTSHWLTSIILIISALVGAYMAYVAKEPFIFTSVWCYISVPIVLVVILNLIANKKLINI